MTWWESILLNFRQIWVVRVPAELVIFSTMMAGVSFEIARRIVGPLIPLLGFLFSFIHLNPLQSLPGVLEHPAIARPGFLNS